MKAFLFPGQGAQFVGMGSELYQRSEAAAKLFDHADEILGFGLRKIMLEGTEDQLKQTRITQPALYVHSMASMVDIDNPDYNYLGGHSLGELTAMAVAGVYDFETGLKIVQHRANAMQDACDHVPGTMAAIVGLDDQIVEEVCDSVEDIVVAANYNCPGQLVISGSISGIDQAIRILKEKGAKMAIKLNVAGAFHSPLMQEARDVFETFVRDICFKTPKVPIVQNVTAVAESDPERLKEHLIQQLTAPVRWTQSMQYLIEEGMTDMVEVGGNGKVLRGLMRRIDRNIKTDKLPSIPA